MKLRLEPNSLRVLLREMSFHVQRQMIAPRERSLTDRAFERFRASVLTIVPRQLVAPRKSPLTFRPLTLVRLFTRMYPLMGLQVRTLRVDFRTTYEITVVNPPFLELGVVPSVELSRDGWRLNSMGRIQNGGLWIRWRRCPSRWAPDGRARIRDGRCQRGDVHQPGHRAVKW